jgi:hypothetical protein
VGTRLRGNAARISKMSGAMAVTTLPSLKGLSDNSTLRPTAEAVGYSRMSLRDRALTHIGIV